MQKTRRFLSLLLTVILVCNGLGVNPLLAAESTPTFEIGNYQGNCGESIQVPIQVKNNPGIAALKLKVSYDSTRLELYSIAYGDWRGNFQQPQKMDSPVSLTWYNGAENYMISDSVFATLTFQILENALPGKSDISIAYDPNNVYNILEDNISFDIQNGTFTVTSTQVCDHSTSSTAYSTNGDGTHTVTTTCTKCDTDISSMQEICSDLNFDNKCDKCGVTLSQSPEAVPTLEIADYTVFPGDSIQIPVTVKNNPGIAAMKLKLAYDTTRLQLVSINYGAWSGNFQQPQTTDSPVSLTWYNGTENYTNKDSAFAVLTFSIIETALPGDAALSITYDPNNVYNIAEDNIHFAIINGVITVSTEKVGVSLNDATEHDATATFSNRSTTTIDAVFVLAAYNSDGKMVGLNMEPCELSPKATYSLSVESVDAEQIATLKGYMLQESSLVPLQSAWETTLSTAAVASD